MFGENELFDHDRIDWVNELYFILTEINMEKIFRIVQGLAFLCIAIWMTGHLKGWLKYSGDKAKEKNDRLIKYRYLLIICSIILYVCGVSLIIVQFFKA